MHAGSEGAVPKAAANTEKQLCSPAAPADDGSYAGCSEPSRAARDCLADHTHGKNVGGGGVRPRGHGSNDGRDLRRYVTGTKRKYSKAITT